MVGSSKDYDPNSYGIYELELLCRLHRLLFFFTFDFQINTYVINSNIFSLQFMVVIACVVIKIM